MSKTNGSAPGSSRVDHGVHTDPAALLELTEVASHEPTEVGPDGAVAGYRADRTLRLSVELKRQLKRRRTQFMLGFVALLPFILVIAFEIGQANPNRSGGFVDLATASAPNFVVLALFVSGTFLLPMIVALFYGDTIASEASWSSLKYLLAIPVPRHRVLRQKAIVSGILSAIALILLPLVSLLVGVIWYGAGDAISPTGDAVTFGDSLIAMGLATVYIILQLAWVAGLAMLLSVTTDAPLGAVGGAVIVAIVSQILDQITALEGLRDYLPTHFAFSWMDLISTDIDWSNMANGMLSAALYGTVFFLLAGRRFATKDITS